MTPTGRSNLYDLVRSKENNFRLNDEHCDVTIYVQDEWFRCHRYILGAKCVYFRIIFGSPFIESYAIHALKGPINAPTFALVLEFIYNNRVPVDGKNFLSLVVASKYLKMPSLEDLCVDFIRGRRHIQNAIDVFKIFRQMNHDRMTSAICDYIDRNFRTISKTVQFLDLQFNDFRLLLDAYSSKDIDHWEQMVDNVKLGVIMKWIRHERDNRLSYLDALVTNHLDLKRLDPDYYLHMLNKLFATDPRITGTVTSSDDSRSSRTDSLNDSLAYAARSDPSLQVCVAFQDRSVGVFTPTHHEEDWHLSCTLSYQNFGFQRRYPKYYSGEEFVILKNVSLDKQLYCLMSDCDLRGKEQTFCTASSIDLKQNFRALSLPPLTIRSGFEMCTSQNSIYFCTYDSDGVKNNQEPEQGLYVYERERDEWFPVSPRSRKVNRACMTADDKVLYLIGDDIFEAYKSHLFAYDSRPSHQWRKLGRVPFEISAIACCVHKGELYANGAWTGGRQTHIFDPRAGRWREGARNMYSDRLNHRLLSFKDRVWAIGGDDPCLNIEVYDPVNHRWSVNEALDNFSNIVEEYPYRVLDAFVFDPN